MLTIDDVRAIPLFSSLSETELERLAQTSADMHLAAGEFAVHEGGERALFAVLSGKIEVVKLFDGIERTLGWRLPGTIFGEVPIAFGTPFPGGYRAAEPSRVMRVDAQQYYAIAAACAGDLREGRRARARAHRRAAGHRRRAAQAARDHGRAPLGYRLRRVAPVPRAQPDHLRLDDARCARTASALARSPPAGRRLPGAAAGRRDAAQPTRARATLPSASGCRRVPRLAEYDTVIIGGGPAGLAAAVYGASEGLRTVVVEREAPGGQAGTSSRIENYLGFPERRIRRRAREPRAPAGAAARGGDSGHALGRRLDPISSARLYLDGDEVVRARTVILATGVTWRRLAIDGFDRLIGKGIYYGAARSEASATHGLDIHLIGAGNSAGQAALYFANHARTVTLVVRGDSLEKSMSHYLIEQLARQVEHRRSNCDRK